MISKSGSIESCDCLVTLYEGSGIEIESSVIKQYGEQIEAVIKDVLNDNNITNIKVVINDKGAFDYTIKSRLLTALKRGNLL